MIYSSTIYSMDRSNRRIKQTPTSILQQRRRRRRLSSSSSSSFEFTMESSWFIISISIIVVVFGISITKVSATTNYNCTTVRNQIDAFGSIDDVLHYLKTGIQYPFDAPKIWACIGSLGGAEGAQQQQQLNNTSSRSIISTVPRTIIKQALPTELYSYPNDPNITNDEKTNKVIMGQGWAYPLPTNEYTPILNKIPVTFIRTLLWKGKLLYYDATFDTTKLINVIGPFPSVLLYRATVYEGPSIIDQNSSIILDYRYNNNPKIGGDIRKIFNIPIIRSIRDEIRQVPWRNETDTYIYFGRTFYYISNRRNLKNDTAYGTNSNFVSVLSFLLDFRPSKQPNLPPWTNKIF